MKNIQKMHNEFIDIVNNNIKRDGINNLIEFLESSDFFRAPASTKYHLCCAGGLLEHSLNVYYEMISNMAYYYGERWQEKFSLETVTIVSLFHDICKIGRYKPGKRNVKDPITGQWGEQSIYLFDENYMNMGHGAKSAMMLMDYIALTDDEKSAIFWHMGAFDVGVYNTATDCNRCFTHNTLAFILHVADMSATYIVENENFDPIPIDIE